MNVIFTMTEEIILKKIEKKIERYSNNDNLMYLIHESVI